MNWLDIIILVLILVPTLIGLKLGIIKILFTVAGMIIGVVLAGRFSETLGEALTFISDPRWANLAAFAIILIVVMIIASVLAGVLKKITAAVLLGWVNRLGGAVLGFIMGFIFCGAILSMWVKFLGIGDSVSDSVLANLLLDNFPVILGLLPAEFDSIRSFFK